MRERLLMNRMIIIEDQMRSECGYRRTYLADSTGSDFVPNHEYAKGVHLLKVYWNRVGMVHIVLMAI